MYHPVAVMLMVGAVISAMQTGYLMWFVHQFHITGWRWYWAKMAPLVAANVWLLSLAVRIFLWG